jgi:uncharacterized protein (DUF2147 family)
MIETAHQPRRPARRRNYPSAAAMAALALALAVPLALHGPAAAQAPAAASSEVTGVWIDHTGQGAVEIGPCNAGSEPGRVCGHVVWMKNAVDKVGRPLTDKENPDRAKRSQPMCGLQIIGGLLPTANGAWDRGWIYNPEDGVKYDVEIKLKARDHLNVHGYLGMKFLGESFSWRRAPATLAKCR